MQRNTVLEDEVFRVGKGFQLGQAIKPTRTIHLKCYAALEFCHIGLLKV